MENIADYKEIVDGIKEKGGEAFKYCYQCGLCDTVCPWNRVRTFSMRKLIRQATFGLTEIESEEMWRCTTCGRCPQRCPRGVGIIEVGVAVAQDGHGIRRFPEFRPSCPRHQREPHGRRQSAERRASKTGRTGRKVFR